MAKLKNRKPLQKYQTGGDTNDPWGFMGSGLSNPASFDISSALTGRGTLNVSTPGQNSINFGDNPFGAQLMSGSLNTARSLSSIPGMSQMNDPMPEWGDETSKKYKDDIVKEKGLKIKYNFWGKPTYTNDKGEEYTEKDIEDLAGQRYDAEKEKRAQFKKMEPLIAPMLQLNELGEMQKSSYAKAQKESMYDVTKSPLSMESKGFFAKEGMRTPPVTEVYRMMGAHQGLPETSYKLAETLDFSSARQKKLNGLLEDILMEEGGNVTSAINEIENLQKTQNNMYNNNQRISRLAMMLGGGLIRGYQEGGMQQPMSPEEEQMLMEQAMQQEMAMQQGQQQPMPQQGGGMEAQQPQPQPQPGENKYMQLPPEQQVEVYKQIIDFVMQNGIDTLEQQYPEEYQFFEEFGDMLEGEDMEEEEGEGEEEMGGEMETEAGRMEMGGGEEEEMEQEYPTDEEEVPVGARPGENAMRPAQPMPGAQQMKEGGIPERYRNMGYNKVGEKKKSNRPGKSWSVLAKKGDKYKVVHGGAAGMQDFTKHKNEERRKRFWQRHGGKDSAKAKNPFSPIYWAKNGFTNAGPTW